MSRPSLWGVASAQFRDCRASALRTPGKRANSRPARPCGIEEEPQTSSYYCYGFHGPMKKQTMRNADLEILLSSPTTPLLRPGSCLRLLCGVPKQAGGNLNRGVQVAKTECEQKPASPTSPGDRTKRRKMPDNESNQMSSSTSISNPRACTPSLELTLEPSKLSSQHS